MLVLTLLGQFKHTVCEFFGANFKAMSSHWVLASAIDNLVDAFEVCELAELPFSAVADAF